MVVLLVLVGDLLGLGGVLGRVSPGVELEVAHVAVVALLLAVGANCLVSLRALSLLVARIAACRTAAGERLRRDLDVGWRLDVR